MRKGGEIFHLLFFIFYFLFAFGVSLTPNPSFPNNK